VATGAFREDLLYRLNLITLRLPTLAERRSDIPLLTGHFLARAAAAYGRPCAPPMVTGGALAWLGAQPWPGNIRQLKQFLDRALLMIEGPELNVAACERVQSMEDSGGADTTLPAVGSMTVDEVEKAMVERSLDYHTGNISKAAESLGLSRAALYRRLEKYGITA